MTAEETRAYCREREWPPGLARGTYEEPHVVPVWGDSMAEHFDSWRAIAEAYTNGACPWLTAYTAVNTWTEDTMPVRVISGGGVTVGRRQNMAPIYEQRLFVRCLSCRKYFTHQTAYSFRSVPPFCPDHMPVTASDFVDSRAESKTRSSAIRDAVAAVVERFRETADTALVRDVVAEAVPNMAYGGKGRDNRRSNAMRELKKMAGVKIDGDQVLFK